MHIFKNRIYFWGLWIGLAFVIFGQTMYVDANEEILKSLNKNIKYDIYIGSTYHLSVIEDVEILRLEEINNKIFLVVQSSDFKLQTEEGFIAFDYIQAILPSRRLLKLHGAQKVYIP